MKTIFHFDCGCKIPIEKTVIKAFNKGSNRYTSNRLCTEHGGHLLHKVVTCEECKTEMKVDSKCNRKKCKCGHLVLVLNGKKPKQTRIRIKGQRVKDCIYCGGTTNAGNKDNLCTKCHNLENEEYDLDLAMFKDFADKVLEARVG